MAWPQQGSNLDMILQPTSYVLELDPLVLSYRIICEFFFFFPNPRPCMSIMNYHFGVYLLIDPDKIVDAGWDW